MRPKTALMLDSVFKGLLVALGCGLVLWAMVAGVRGAKRGSGVGAAMLGQLGQTATISVTATSPAWGPAISRQVPQAAPRVNILAAVATAISDASRIG